jgi:hypothetical protein
MELTYINGRMVWHLPPNIAGEVAQFPRSLKNFAQEYKWVITGRLYNSTS